MWASIMLKPTMSRSNVKNAKEEKSKLLKISKKEMSKKTDVKCSSWGVWYSSQKTLHEHLVVMLGPVI